MWRPCPDALLFAARDCEGALQGFAVGDYTALGTVFYLFAFRAPESPPGTADALLDALAAEGIRRGHTLLNLGLGINPGIVFFKRKWNATILRPHVETSWAVQRPQEAGLARVPEKTVRHVGEPHGKRRRRGRSAAQPPFSGTFGLAAVPGKPVRQTPPA